MPKVPVYNQQVRRQTGTVSSQQTTNPPQAAFGMDVAQSEEKIGQAVERLGGIMADHAIKMQERENEKFIVKTDLAFRQALQKTLMDPVIQVGPKKKDAKPGSEKGFLQRQLSETQGSTDEFALNISKELKTAYLVNANGFQKQKLEALMDGHILSATGQIASHEAQQLRQDTVNTIESSVTVAGQEAGFLKTPKDLDGHIKRTLSVIEPLYQNLGNDKKATDALKIKVTGQLVKEAVLGNIERNVYASKAILNSALTAKQIDAGTAAQLQRTIDGKILDDVQHSTWDGLNPAGPTSSLYMNEDGTCNTAKMMEAIDATKKLPAAQMEQVKSYVMQKANIYDRDLVQNRSISDRDFYNTILDAKAKGATFDQLLPEAAKGYDEKNREERKKALLDLFTDNTKAFYDKASEKQTTAQKLMMERIEKELVIPAYGNKKAHIPGLPDEVSLKDSAMLEMQEAFSRNDKSPDEMWKIANEKMEDAVTKKRAWWFDQTETAWKVDRESRVTNSEKMSKLNTVYGDVLVEQAKAAINRRNDGTPPTTDNIQRYIESVKQGKRKIEWL